MSEKKTIIFTYLSKKKTERKVRFLMDKEEYEILFDPSINSEYRNQYLIDEFHAFEREKYYKRKHPNIDFEIAEFLLNKNQQQTQLEKDLIIEDVKKFLVSLPKYQREVIQKKYFEDKSQKQIAQELGISESYVSKLLDSAISNLQKKFKK